MREAANPSSRHFEKLLYLFITACAIGPSAAGCASSSPAGAQNAGGAQSTNGGAGTGGASSGSTVNGTGGSTVPCSPPGTRTNRHLGDYDYESCSNCHNNWWGGWVYNNAAGDAWVAGATVTITNQDGSKINAITESEGFFYLENGTIGSKYTACVSKCPDTICSVTEHTSPDCQTSNCHGKKNLLIYLPQGSATNGTGGASGTGCKAPASGGPRVHSSVDFDGSDKDCRICHDSSYTGGYVYDGVTSNNVVSMATVTIKPTSGAQITAVSGPGGMFFLGDYGTKTTTIPLTAPYTACVSKCPKTVCSDAGTHTTTDNCGTCHNDQQRIYLN